MTEPRWLEVARKEPNRWIDHPAPYVGHRAGQMCSICLVEPVGPSEQEYDEVVEALKEKSEQLLSTIERLAAATAAAHIWQKRAEQAEEILEAYAKQAGRAGGRASRPRWFKR